MDCVLKSVFNEEKDCWEIDISGEIDIFNSDEFKDKLLGLVRERQKDIFLDCTKLDYIDSTALGALVAVLKNVRNFGGAVHIKNAKPNILKLFKITNLDKVFTLEG